MHLTQTGVIKTDKIQVVDVALLRDIESVVGESFGTGEVFHVFVGNHGSMIRIVA